MNRIAARALEASPRFRCPPWAAFYVLLVVCPLYGILLLAQIYSATGDVTAPAPANLALPTRSHLFEVLAAIIAVLILSQFCGAAFRWLRQPRVLGEVTAGLLLGPCALGLIAPDITRFFTSPELAPILAALGQLGLVLFMFLVGLEFDFSRFSKQGPAALLISHASIALPFLAGMGLAAALLDTDWRGDASPLAFMMFLGLALSITAFPVLTRILQERGLLHSNVGAMALVCAASDDITAWCLLPVVLGLSHVQATSAFGTAATIIGYCLAIYCGGRLLPSILRRLLPPGHLSLSLLLLGLLIAAMSAEWLGFHAFFGAFVFGLCVPREAIEAEAIRGKISPLVDTIFLPLFFAMSGMKAHFGFLQSSTGWLVCGLVIGVAVLAKGVSSVAAARLSNFSWHDSVALGALLNTRGMMEIIVANIGLECGIISPAMFTILVIMALVTCLIAGPILDLLTSIQVLERKDLAQV